MANHGLFDEVVAVVKLFADGTYYYNLYVFTRIKEFGGKPTYSRQVFAGVFTTKDDFAEMQVVSVEGGDVVVGLKSKPEFISNFIKLLTFKKETGKYVLSASTNLMTSTDSKINIFSLMYIGRKRVAVLATATGVLGFVSTIWDTDSRGIALVPTNTLVEITSTDKRKINIEYMRCFPNNDDMLQCVVDSEGIVDYLLDITFDQNYEETGEYIRSIVKSGEFEMPPFFDIKRLGKGQDVFAFLLKKTQAS